ncbi:hypothetical protein FB451DRAFT_1172987 [Mycena latifolia]|nr:hypothetical protein FB451DRAFT_1172987 [Mycena latifolia]
MALSACFVRRLPLDGCFSWGAALRATAFGGEAGGRMLFSSSVQVASSSHVDLFSLQTSAISKSRSQLRDGWRRKHVGGGGGGRDRLTQKFDSKCWGIMGLGYGHSPYSHAGGENMRSSTSIFYHGSTYGHKSYKANYTAKLREDTGCPRQLQRMNTLRQNQQDQLNSARFKIEVSQFELFQEVGGTKALEIDLAKGVPRRGSK